MTGLSHPIGLWRIIQDEAGNHVLDQDNIKGRNSWNRILFGNMTWKDYVIVCQLRFVDVDSSDNEFTNTGVNFRYDNLDPLAGSYDASMLTRGTLYMGYGNDRTSHYFELTHSDGYNVVVKQWYKIRVEIDNNTYKFYIDDNEVLEATDSTSLFGPAGFTVGPALHVQFDNISVTEIIH